MNDITDWMQAIGAVVAILISILALIQSGRAARDSRRIQQQERVRILAEKTNAVKFSNTVSPSADNKERILTVAAKAEKYEELFNVYGDLLPDSLRTRLRGQIADQKQKSQTALDSATLATDQDELNRKTADYGDSMAVFVITFEEAVADALSKLA